MMDKLDRWVLPEGIEEVLPAQALKTERLRRCLVDLFIRWGYDYVIPPMVEFTDSLLTGSGSDVDLLTFKLTDQLSGKTMGLRADITPQAARMDAHSLRREGGSRLCYAGHVMRTRPKGLLGSRAPILLGVELFGEPSLQADIEVLSLLLESLTVANLADQYIDIGHVSVFRALIRAAEFSFEQEAVYFEMLQAKATPEIDRWLSINVGDEQCRDWLQALPRLAGSPLVLEKARTVFQSAPALVGEAIDELEAVCATLSARYPSAQLYLDLGELRGYHYHTGLVFGAFASGVGSSIASGGRYDHVGEAFGRARPATGFNLDLSALTRLELASSDDAPLGAIFAPHEDGDQQWEKIQSLRNSGERVVVGLLGQKQPLAYQRCDRCLVQGTDGYEVRAIK